jgi:reactive intermediate/imine deaminase
MICRTRSVVVAAVVSALMAGAAAAQPAPSAQAARDALIYVPGITAPGAPGFAQQVEGVLGALGEQLKASGSSLEHVVATTVYLSDAADFPALNAAWGKAWPKEPPTRTTVVARLPVAGAKLQVAAVALPAGAPRTIVLPAGWAKPTNPYSWAIRAGDTLFLSGLVPRNPKDNTVVAGDIGVQTKAIFDNARALVEAAGLSLANVASARVYLADAANFQAMNGLYRPYFPADPPARATVKMTLPNPQDLIEITFTAVAGSGRAAYTTPTADGKPGQPNPNLSSAIRVGSRVYVAGMLGVVPGAAPDLAAQSKETLDRLERTLTAAGASWSNVVEAVVYVTDTAKAAAVVQALKARCPSPAPTVVGTGLVSPEGLVEIMLVAAK